MRIFAIVAFAWIIARPGLAQAGTEGMPQMPLARETRTSVATGKEDYEAIQGFGADASKVEMMNLMMVEGSGYEGMDMSGMDHAPAPKAEPELTPSGVTNTSPFEVKSAIRPDPPQVGANQLDFTLDDRKTGKPASGLTVECEVFMTSMSMGTERPKVSEVEPGHYRVTVQFTMKGPWAVRIRALPRGETEHSRMWENLLNFRAG